MIIFKDIISNDELISDVYDLKETAGGTLLEADCQMITVKDGDVDIGANPSAEGGDDGGAEDGVKTVNNVIYSFRLNQSGFDKKTYLTYLKGYMKSVKSKLQEAGKSADEVADFEKRAQSAVKDVILKNFKNYEFYVGEKMDPESMVVLLNYREDGVTPYVTLWKDGLKEEKV